MMVMMVMMVVINMQIFDAIAPDSDSDSDTNRFISRNSARGCEIVSSPYKKGNQNFYFYRVAECRGSSGHIHVKMAKCGKMRQF